MITEAQFTDAMERAVALRGKSWRYPTALDAPSGFYAGYTPTYSDENGNPTCLIGVFMDLLGMQVPRGEESPGCIAILMGPMSMRVALAARCAQVHQDNHRPWGEALSVYRAALAIQDKRTYSPFEAMDLYRLACQTAGTDAMSRVTSAMQTMKELDAAFAKMTAATESITFDGFATAGVITSASFGPITVNAIKTYSGATAFTFNEAFLPTKAEHALTA